MIAAGGMVWSAWHAGKDMPLEENTVLVRGPVVLGAALPLSGAYAERGAQLRSSIEYAVSEINEAGGVHGFNIDVVWKDTACTDQGARAAAESLTDEDAVRVIIGGVCESEIKALAGTANERQVLLVTPFGQRNDVSSEEGYVFSLGTTLTRLATTSAVYAYKDLQAHEAFMVLDPDASVESVFASSLTSSFTVQGGTMVGTYPLPRQTQSTSTDPLMSLESNIDMIVLAVADPVLAQTALASLKLSGTSANIISDASLFDGIPSEQLDQYEGVLFAKPDNGIKQVVFDDLIKHVRGESQATVSRPADLALLYSAVYLLRDAFLSVGLDPVRIREYLLGLSRWNGGAITDLTFDEHGAAVRDILIQQVKDGKVVTVKRY